MLAHHYRSTIILQLILIVVVIVLVIVSLLMHVPLTIQHVHHVMHQVKHVLDGVPILIYLAVYQVVISVTHNHNGGTQLIGTQPPITYIHASMIYILYSVWYDGMIVHHHYVRINGLIGRNVMQLVGPAFKDEHVVQVLINVMDLIFASVIHKHVIVHHGVHVADDVVVVYNRVHVVTHHYHHYHQHHG